MRTLKASLYTVPALLIVVLLAALLVGASASATPPAQEGPTGPVADPQFLMNYQGRLLNPTTGEPLPDGPYPSLFRLYDQATGGAPLWSEEGVIEVTNGVFSTVLGDLEPLNPDTFAGTFLGSGQTLWLGIRIGSDPEMEPRQQLTFVGYAMYAHQASNAVFFDGRGRVVLANAAHTHSGNDIVGGVVAEGVIGPAIARDAEVMGLVTASDGVGSGLDADRLDGQDSSAFAAAGHSHTALPIAYAYIQSNGTKVSGTSNVSSAWLNNRYEITLAGHSYFFSSYTTVVTLVSNCPYNATVRTSSVSGNLLVYVYNSAGTQIQCDFQFVTFKP